MKDINIDVRRTNDINIDVRRMKDINIDVRRMKDISNIEVWRMKKINIDVRRMNDINIDVRRMKDINIDDAWDVTLSVYPHRASLKNMPDHGGNRTYDLWNTSPMLCQLSYAVNMMLVMLL